MAETAEIAIVIPCYNEAGRIEPSDFERYTAAHPDTRFVFVDDGSTDDTLSVLRGLEEKGCGEVLALGHNRGKAEAVRQGMLHAFERGAALAGYWDADLATPLSAIDDFAELLHARAGVSVVFGARVQLLGRSVQRSPLRHYLGRVFATATSLTLRLGIYDTQCGAKLFRATPRVREIFEEPFGAGWIFDVEILARLIRQHRVAGGAPPTDLVYELPLRQWHDVAGSKVRARDFPRALLQLGRIWWHYLR